MSTEKKMLLGIQPTCWTNDDFPEIGNEIPYQVVLDQIKEAGFEGGSTGHNYPVHVPSLLHEMKSRGLKISSTWVGTAFTTGANADAALADFQAQMTFLEEVGAHDVVVAELANAVNQVRTKSVLTDRPVFNGPQWYLLTTLLDRAGKIAHDQGMQLSYHPHVGTGVLTINETVRLLESTNPDYVGLCLDTAHLRFGGASKEDVVKLTKKYAKRITHVHLKNIRSRVLDLAVEDKLSFYDAIRRGIFTVPGDGEDDSEVLKRVLKILQKSNYDRWLIVEAEQDPNINTSITPLDYAKMARAFLYKQLGY